MRRGTVIASCIVTLAGLALWLATVATADGGRPAIAPGREPGGGVAPGHAITATVGPAIDPAIAGKIEPALLKEALREEDGVLNFIVHLREQADLTPAQSEVSVLARRQRVVRALQATADRSQVGLRDYLAQRQASGAVTRYTPYWVFNGLAVTADRQTLLDLAARPEVDIIRADHERRLEEMTNAPLRRLGNSFQAKSVFVGQEAPHGRGYSQPSQGFSSSVEWNIAKIRADLVWSRLQITGTGVVVANMDTGVDWQHPALMTKYRGYNPKGLPTHTGNWYCATNEGYTYPGDGYGHGTHTMGTIVGDEGIGVAPGARWIAVKIFNDSGLAYDSWIHAGFQWILAPGGDPALAPDVVNNSWGSSNGADTTFLADVQAWRAAGIFPVFSSGNSGVLGVGSPASFAESFAVGATDSTDLIASFSSRGPSPWGEIKPEVTAPGVSVRSSLPGGAYGNGSGTSMAAPHVAGLVALMKQAQPGLTITDTEHVITGTAVALGSPLPNNEYGWGRIDAYQAVASIANVGILSGTVRDAGDGHALAGATLSIVEHGSGITLQATTGDDGVYTVALAPAAYDATASAFGYTSSTVLGLWVYSHTTTVQDFSLTTLPTGTLTGRVTEQGTGQPLTATVFVVGAPVTITTDPATGWYTVTLPIGTHDLKATSEAHRIGWASGVTVTQGSTVRQDFSLAPAPTILLVDSGRWYNGSRISYFRQALDDLDYLYDEWPITQSSSVPTATDLIPYDVVVWSSPLDSPGLAGAEDAVTGYLDQGGRLFVTGQDVGYWDGGGSGFFWSAYYSDYLKARYVADDAGSRRLSGLADDIFDGLDLIIEGAGGADNQLYPDSIAVTDPDYATSVVQYQGDGSGGQRVGLCLPYRAVYLSFGFEAITSTVTRREVMDRTINWLTSPAQTVGLKMSPLAQTAISPRGTTVTHTVRLRNTGEVGGSDVYSLTIGGYTWPTVLLSDTVAVSSCTSVSLTVVVSLPPDAGWNVSDTVRLVARSSLSPTLAQTVTLTTKTQAPILLVDDDRWYDQEAHYESALAANGLAYDYWNVNDEWPWDIPSLDRLRWYPLVMWFTGYDWYQTLTPDEEARLAAYLDSGGRLFFSGQDYLYTAGLTDFGREYLGVVSYTQDVTVTMAYGVDGNPVGGGLGPYTLTYPYLAWSDVVSPNVAMASAAFANEYGWPIGLTRPGDGYRTVFFGFPFEALDADAAGTVMDRIAGWLGWLGASTVAADREVVDSGGVVSYTVVVRNDGWRDVASATLSNTIPANTVYVPGSLQPPPVVYHPLTNTITWGGPLSVGESLTVTYRVTVATGVAPGTYITNVAHLHYSDHGFDYVAWDVTRADAPDLSASTLVVDKGIARPGDSLVYTVTLLNVGTHDALSATLSAGIPAYTHYLSGSLSAMGGGVAGDGGAGISWTGPLSTGQPVTLTYRVVITDSYADFSVSNLARVVDDFGQMVERTALTTVSPYRLYLPLIFKDHEGRPWPGGGL